jgi:hypothetical protein
MDPPASFSSLPPELVTNICNDSVLRKKDLIALRLTSKSQGIHLSASKEFAKRVFMNNRLLYTRYSLQTFVEICRHPIFGPAVRKIQLSYTRFLPEFFDDEGKRLFEGFYGGRESESRHCALKDIRLLVKRCDEEEDLRNSSDAEGLLAAAFTALSHWHHPLELGMSSDESHTSQDRIYSHHMLGELEHWECDILGTVALLSNAAALSNCVVQGLQIQGAVYLQMIWRSQM